MPINLRADGVNETLQHEWTNVSQSTLCIGYEGEMTSVSHSNNLDE